MWRRMAVGLLAAALLIGYGLVAQRQTSGNTLAAPTAITANLVVSTSTYLAGAGVDAGAAVEVAPDRTLVYAGKLTAGVNFGLTPISLLNGGSGALLRLNAAGTAVLAVTRIGGSVDDMDLDHAGGAIAVVGDFGLAYLNPAASELLWTRPLGSGTKRVAVANGGKVIALAGKTLSVYDPGGNLLGQWTLPNSRVNDVAIDAASASVYVAGDDNKTLPSNLPVRVVYLYSYSFAGTSKWANYDWPGSQLAGNAADTKYPYLNIGRDGYLYLAASADGGNNMLRSDPHSLSQPAPVVGFDNYNQTSNTSGAINLGFYARYDAADGTIRKAQFVLTRKDDGRGNSFNPLAIAADELGNVYVGGQAAYKLAARDGQQIDGQTLAVYSGYEASVLIVRPDFTAPRLLWTSWTGPGANHNSLVNGVAAGRGIAAMAANSSGGTLLTANALQAAGSNPSSTNPDGFLAVWQAQAPALGPADFYDVPTDSLWYSYVHYLAQNGIVNGTSPGYFSPNANTTRGQFAKMVSLGFALPAYTPTAPSFHDVAASSIFYPYIEAAVQAGIVGGYSQDAQCGGPGTAPCYLPNTSISRVQVVIITVRAKGWPLITPGAASFRDLPPSYQFYREVETAVQRGVINGYTQEAPCGGAGTAPCFLPNNPSTRGQLSKVLYLAITAPTAAAAEAKPSPQSTMEVNY